MVMPLHMPQFAVDDLESFPSDGNRYELLDGFLLVTPAPEFPHQFVTSRLVQLLGAYLNPVGRGIVLGPGAVELRPKTHLEPDVLVLPAPTRGQKNWSDFSSWWLAIEVLSRSSRMYDRNIKRDAYLALGVAEVWLVDRDAKEVLVSRLGEPVDVPHGERLTWAPAGMDAPLDLDLDEVFAGLD
jgi:Uma2 family endonuclease